MEIKCKCVENRNRTMACEQPVTQKERDHLHLMPKTSYQCLYFENKDRCYCFR